MEAYKKSQSDEFSQLFQSRAAESAQHFVAGPIITPLAQQQQQRNSKRKHDNDENDAVILPHLPATGIAIKKFWHKRRWNKKKMKSNNNNNKNK